MRRFRAILAREGVSTDEGWLTRVFPDGCFEWDAGKHTFTAHHDDRDLLGFFDDIERLGGLIIAHGWLNDDGVGVDADRRRDLILQIEQGVINAVSVEASGVDVTETCTHEDADGFCDALEVRFDRYKIGAASLVTIPAIEGTLIELEPADGPSAADEAIAAAAAVSPWHAEWFDDPELAEWTKLTVTDDGRVFGHVAGATCHVSLPNCETAWRSPSGYHYAHQCGPVDAVAADGAHVEIPVAPLATQGGHYPVLGEDPATGQRYSRQWQQAAAHYDDPSTCAAYVRFGDDEHGIWMAGQIAPWATPQQVTILRMHPPSGDWRPIEGHRELIAACCVNIPGFPSARREVAYAASAGGVLEPEAMVAVALPPAHHHECGCGGTCDSCAGTAAGLVSRAGLLEAAGVLRDMQALASRIAALEGLPEVDAQRARLRERLAV